MIIEQQCNCRSHMRNRHGNLVSFVSHFCLQHSNSGTVIRRIFAHHSLTESLHLSPHRHNQNLRRAISQARLNTFSKIAILGIHGRENYCHVP